VRAFDAQQRSDHAIAAAPLDVGRSAGETDVLRTAQDELTKKVDLLVHCARQPACVGQDRKRYEAEKLRPDASVSHPWDIHVSAECRTPKGSVVPLVNIVAEPPRPHECVGVQVDWRMQGVQGLSVVGAAHGLL
jgi:hypothetical protein